MLPWSPILNSDRGSKTRPGAPTDSMTDSNEVNSQPRNSKLSVETLLPTSKSEIPIDTFSATKSVDAQAQVNSKPSVPNPSEQPRVLSLRHFAKALKEITPSSSESLGSLAELRKWNEEFGEGETESQTSASMGAWTIWFLWNIQGVVRKVRGRWFLPPFQGPRF